MSSAMKAKAWIYMDEKLGFIWQLELNGAECLLHGAEHPQLPLTLWGSAPCRVGALSCTAWPGEEYGFSS